MFLVNILTAIAVVVLGVFMVTSPNEPEKTPLKFFGSYRYFQDALGKFPSETIRIFKDESVQRADNWFLEYFTRSEARALFPDLNNTFLDEYYDVHTETPFNVSRYQTQPPGDEWTKHHVEEIFRVAREVEKRTTNGDILLIPGRSGLPIYEALKLMRADRKLLHIDISSITDNNAFLYPEVRFEGDAIRSGHFLTGLLTPRRFQYFMGQFGQILAEAGLSWNGLAGKRIFLIDYMSSGSQLYIWERLLAEQFAILGLPKPAVSFINLAHRPRNPGLFTLVKKVVECGVVKQTGPIDSFQCYRVRYHGSEFQILGLILFVPYQELLIEEDTWSKLTHATSEMSWGKYNPVVLWNEAYEGYRKAPPSPKAQNFLEMIRNHMNVGQ